MMYILLTLSFCFLLVPALIGYLSNDFVELYNLTNCFGDKLQAKMGLIVFVSLLGAAAVCVFYLYSFIY